MVKTQNILLVEFHRSLFTVIHLIRYTILGDGNELTLNEIIAQCFTFFSAGYETSSTTMAFALYELAVHPDIQEKVREEILQVSEKYSYSMNYESLKELVYLEQILNGTYCSLGYNYIVIILGIVFLRYRHIGCFYKIIYEVKLISVN